MAAGWRSGIRQQAAKSPAVAASVISRETRLARCCASALAPKCATVRFGVIRCKYIRWQHQHCKRLSMQSVAEGVETEGDWHLMRELECDFAQGYFIGKPMASDRVDDGCEQWSARNAELPERWN